MTTVADFVLKNYVIYPPSANLCRVKEEVICREDKFIIEMNSKEITKVVRSCSVLNDILKLEEDQSLLQEHVLSEIYSDLTFSVVAGNKPIQVLKELVADIIIVTNEDASPIGIKKYKINVQSKATSRLSISN